MTNSAIKSTLFSPDQIYITETYWKLCIFKTLSLYKQHIWLFQSYFLSQLNFTQKSRQNCQERRLHFNLAWFVFIDIPSYHLDFSLADFLTKPKNWDNQLLILTKRTSKDQENLQVKIDTSSSKSFYAKKAKLSSNLQVEDKYISLAEYQNKN